MRNRILQKDIQQAVILAGGLGTRMRPLTDNIPKPMIDVNDRPFVEYLIRMLKENGIKEVVLLLGYRSEVVIDYFTLNPVEGIKIVYHQGETQWNTGTRVKKGEHLYDDTFLLMYCDNYWPLNLHQQLELFNKHDASLVLTVYNNSDNYTRSNIHVNDDARVTYYDPQRKDPGLNGVDMGFFIFRKSLVKTMPEHEFHLTHDFLPPLIEEGKVYALRSDQVYYSIGSLERLPVTKEYLTPKKFIFLDRDGVINKKAPKADYVKTPEEFEFLPGVLESIKLLTDHDYKIVIITNQAGIARGMMSEEDLNQIHNYMLSNIEAKGGRIEKIYHCPHGWDEGCSCRKPKPGMLLNASREYVTDITRAVFIGDDERDIMAAEAANMNSLLVSDSVSLLDLTQSIVTHGEAYTLLYYDLLKIYREKGKKLFTLAIGGCSRTGKSTLAERLIKDLQKEKIPCKLLSLDNWIKDYRDRKKTDSVRERFDYNGITHSLESLQKGQNTSIPVYDAKTRSVLKEPQIYEGLCEGILITEGVVALDIPWLSENADYRIFVDTEDSVRLDRVRRFYREFKKLSQEETEIIIQQREKDEVAFIKENIFKADFIYKADISGT